MEDRLKRIKNRWMPDDGFGIGHPIIEEELEEDVRFLVDLVEAFKDALEFEGIDPKQTVKECKEHAKYRD